MNRRILTILTMLMIFWGFQSVDWTGDIIHRGGRATAEQLVSSLLNPDLSTDTLTRTVEAAGTTVSYAIAGMSVSIAIAFFLGILASGILFNDSSPILIISRGTRGLLTFMRSIHELVWAWLFVAAFGLHPLSAILALGIPYGGTLGRIFADMLADVPKEPIDALSNSGASRMQRLFYVYLPYALPNMVSYSMYRFECAVRASTVMSFVGLGGLGYQIQLSLGDLEYAEAFTYLYGLILLILCIEIWSSQLRKSLSQNTGTKWNLERISLIGSAAGIGVSWIYIHLSEGVYLNELFNDKNMKYTMKFLRGLLGIGEELPAFMDLEKWTAALELSLETLQMSVLSIFLAGFFAILLAIPAARTEPTVGKKGIGLARNGLFAVLRGLFIGTRAIPELIWAMLFVFLFKPGPLPGVLALAVHNFGILGKLCAEVVENMDRGPIDGLKSAGSGTLQTLFYGVLPLTLPKFITYVLYRWEVIIRTTIIVGFVGAGGLGQAFKLSMSWFHYSDITLYLICYLILIGGVDKLSRILRQNIE